MTTKIIYVNLNFNGADLPGARWQDNQTQVEPTSTQTLFADLLDSASASTGYALDITTAFNGRSGATTQSTADVGDWDDEVFDYFFFDNASAALQISGLNNGDTFSLELAGHTTFAARDTNYTVTPADQGQTLYDSAGTGVANAPIIFTGTIGAAGTIDIVGALVDTFWYINAFKLTVADNMPASFSQTFARVTR